MPILTKTKGRKNLTIESAAKIVEFVIRILKSRDAFSLKQFLCRAHLAFGGYALPRNSIWPSHKWSSLDDNMWSKSGCFLGNTFQKMTERSGSSFLWQVLQQIVVCIDTYLLGHLELFCFTAGHSWSPRWTVTLGDILQQSGDLMR